MTPVQQGFILTRQQKEVAGRSVLEFWLNTEAGAARVTTASQQSVFFMAQSDIEEATQHLANAGVPSEVKPLTLNTFEHVPVAGFYFDKMSQFYRARDSLKQAGITLFEDDIRLTERFMMERFINAGVSFTGRHQLVNGVSEYRDALLKPADYTPTFSLLSLDIECSENGELYSVGLSNREFQTVIMIGQPEPGPDWIVWVDNEKALLLELIEQVKLVDPDMFIGWSVVNFDFRLLVKRAEILGIKLVLGRTSQPIGWRDSKTDPGQGFVTIPGRLVLDGIDGLKTATYQFDSFSLENVAQTLLGKGKDTDNVDDRLATIKHDFLHNKVKLAEYNLQDCILVEEIFAHTNLLGFLTLRSQLTGLELDRSGGSVAAFVNLYLPKLHRAGYISPNRPAHGGLASPGGYVMNSFPGLYRNVLVLDFKSLYPSIIRTFKIDPMGLIEGLRHQENAIPGYKGGMFSREKHFLPEIITSLWKQRDEAKKNNDDARSQAIKILMNSFYGVLGSGGCPFYDTRLASSITMRGHDIMQTTAKWIEDAGYKVIYGDTDSTFVWLEGDIDTKHAMEIGKRLEHEINQKWTQLIEQEYQLNSDLEIEFETHFERFLMPTIRGSELGSKKRYAGLKTKGTGSELVFKGLETVRSDWTPLAKEFQQQLYEMVFSDQDVSYFLTRTIALTREGKNDHKLVYRKRLRQRLDKYVKNVPPHVKAARIADHINQTRGKALKYQHKGWISYVITTNGPEPIEYIAHPLDYEHYIEKQIRPIAEGILPFVNVSFEQLTSAQMALF